MPSKLRLANAMVEGSGTAVVAPLIAKSVTPASAATSKRYQVPVEPVAPQLTIRKLTGELAGTFCSSEMPLKSIADIDTPGLDELE